MPSLFGRAADVLPMTLIGDRGYMKGRAPVRQQCPALFMPFKSGQCLILQGPTFKPFWRRSSVYSNILWDPFATQRVTGPYFEKV